MKNFLIFFTKKLDFFKKCDIVYIKQSCGVMVAQVILAHLAEVRLLTGLPFLKLYDKQSRGVMAAQVVLVHLVEVRILAGLPFFCLKKMVNHDKDCHFFV